MSPGAGSSKAKCVLTVGMQQHCTYTVLTYIYVQTIGLIALLHRAGAKQSALFHLVLVFYTCHCPAVLLLLFLSAPLCTCS